MKRDYFEGADMAVTICAMDGILFCGDAAMKNFPSIKRTIIWIENLDDYKQSWEKMIALNPKRFIRHMGNPSRPMT